jgi:hypothetical protein
MSSADRPAGSTIAPIVVFGAAGVLGRRVCDALAAAAVPHGAVGRHPRALEEAAPGASIRVATADDPAALARAFAGAQVVVNAAGPMRELGDGILVAALEAGAHYVDLAAEQGYLHAMYERHESTARRAGRIALLGAGVAGTLGDWAAAVAARRHDADDRAAAPADDDDDDDDDDGGALLRFRPAPRLATARPLDELAISYVFDDLALSPGSQRTLFLGVGSRPVRWRRDRWEACAVGERRPVDAGPGLGGPRVAMAFPGPDVISVPRTIAATTVQTYLSTTRHVAAATALGLLARALPHIPRGLSDLLAPTPMTDDAYPRTRFAVVAQARRGFAASQVVVSGRDLYRTSAEIAAFLATALADRGPGPVGMRTASELFHPAAALAAIADRAGLEIDPPLHR